MHDPSSRRSSVGDHGTDSRVDSTSAERAPDVLAGPPRRLTFNTVWRQMRTLDDCLELCAEEQPAKTSGASTNEPSCRFVTASLTAPNWECSLHTHCNLTRLYLPRAWEDANPALTLGHPLVDHPVQRPYDFVSMELPLADAARIRERVARSSAGHLQALAAPGSCKQGFQHLMLNSTSRRGRRKMTIKKVRSGNSSKIMTLPLRISLGIRSILDCAKCCQATEGCCYITYTSRGLTECSLFSTCELSRLARQSHTVSLGLTSAVKQIISHSQ